jgi:hypothetical protein
MAGNERKTEHASPAPLFSHYNRLSGGFQVFFKKITGISPGRGREKGGGKIGTLTNKKQGTEGKRPHML